MWSYLSTSQSGLFSMPAQSCKWHRLLSLSYLRGVERVSLILLALQAYLYTDFYIGTPWRLSFCGVVNLVYGNMCCSILLQALDILHVVWSRKGHGRKLHAWLWRAVFMKYQFPKSKPFYNYTMKGILLSWALPFRLSCREFKENQSAHWPSCRAF